MSNKAINWALAQKLRAPAKPVLLALANRLNEKSGLCNPSHRMIAQDTGLSIATVKTVLNGMRGRYLDWQPQLDPKSKGRKPNQYQLFHDRYEQCGSEPPGRELSMESPEDGGAPGGTRLPPQPRDGEKTKDKPFDKQNRNRESISVSNIGNRTGATTRLNP
jgi:hypothetical protein